MKLKVAYNLRQHGLHGIHLNLHHSSIEFKFIVYLFKAQNKLVLKWFTGLFFRILLRKKIIPKLHPQVFSNPELFPLDNL